MSQVQFFKSYLRWKLGGTYYYVPCLPNAILSCPGAFIVPPVIGAVAKVNYCYGLRIPVVDVNLVQLDGMYPAGSIGPLTHAFISYAFDRGPLFDTIPFGDGLTTGIDYWDGNSGFTLVGAKFESIRIGTAKGADLNIACRFVGTGITVIESPVSVPVWSNNSPLRFQSLNYGSPLTGLVWATDFSYSNQHRPVRQIISGTPFPYAMVAGAPIATINLITQTADGGIVPTGGPLGFTVSGNSSSMSITATNVINNTVDNRRIQIPRTMREHSLMLLGNQGDISPIFYTSSF